MVVHHPLDDLLLSWTHIAVVRPLQHAKQGLTGREIARLAGIHHRTCLDALTALESLAVVQRLRGGRDHLFSLNGEHVLVQTVLLPLLAAERGFQKDLFRQVATACRKHCVSVIVFGSVARHEETVESDLDVCLVVENNRKSIEAQERLSAIAPQLHRRFGVKLAPFIVTRSEFVRRAGKKLPPVRDILQEGVVIAGASLMEVLGGKK
ncbi:MAG: nucleotidyltransferase domain-containing protein [Bacteroidetes bacterium]|nr:nucleotidyltransferase domain-containing protein [Bacteroidota bacterium]MCW5896723.1 nucleotidyltransferase domain-containing protein [Bacteroidota bacterium]